VRAPLPFFFVCVGGRMEGFVMCTVLAHCHSEKKQENVRMLRKAAAARVWQASQQAGGPPFTSQL